MALLACVPARAEDLRIAMKGAVDGTDPHQSFSANRMVQLHVYETLLVQDEPLRAHPALAESLAGHRSADLGVHPPPWRQVP